NPLDQNSIIDHLQDQMEQLEQKLLEIENYLKALENSTRKVELMRLQSNAEGLQ
ncbi:hypothetical protein GOP47_0012182, partial [Adiantum capillus-veneris]